MIELVKTPTMPVFLDLVDKCNKEMILCTPFIKKQIVKEILNHKKQNSKITIITSANISNFIQGSSDLSAIRQLLENNIKVINYQDLHAKIYLFDKKAALVTSANLTYSGMNHNYEYGVLIKNDKDSINHIRFDFNNMIKSSLAGKFNVRNIDLLDKTIKQIDSSKYKIKEINGDNTLMLYNLNFVVEKMCTWQKEVFLIVNNIPNNEFTLKEVYEYTDFLSGKHPKNNNIGAKIRQTLQQLRDMGLIKFVNPGEYKKLFITQEQ